MKYRVLDFINTDECARELLSYRVAQVNEGDTYANDICCADGRYVASLRERGRTVHIMNTPRSLSPFRLIGAIVATFRLLRRERYDIIHTHTSVPGMVGRVAACLARTRFVVHQFHGFHHHDGMPTLKRRLFVSVERVLVWFADKVLFQNEKDRDECLRHRIAPRRKMVVIGNGVQLTRFRSLPEPDNDPPVLICVARLEPVKNHMMLLEAARILKDRGVPFVLNIVGGGELMPEYREWLRAHGLEPDVHLLGYRDDVAELITQANLCVLVSIKEGLPRAIIEAGASARAMVATDVIGNRDALVNGETGLLVPLDDSAALADAVQELLEDSDRRKAIGRQARAHAEQHFDERVVTERIIEVYDRGMDR